MEAKKVIEDRKKRYKENSTFRDRARIAQGLKGVVHNSPFFSCLSWEEREALDLILHKIARIAGGEVDRKDSWVDIAGYASLIAERVY